MKRSIDFCALRYLNIWLEHDKGWHEAITKKENDRKTIDKKFQAISKAAASYKVARNVPTEFDTGLGLKRYEPVINILDKIDINNFESDPISKIKKIAGKISQKYDNRNLLSFTTKMLWLKVRSPVLIYDKRARDALGTTDGDLEAFHKKWHEEYSIHRKDISAACQRLSEVAQYTCDEKIGSVDYIKSITKENWFQHRVFDIYLWNIGGKDEVPVE